MVAAPVVLLALVDVDARRDVIQLVPFDADTGWHAVDHVTLVIATVIRRTNDR